LTPQQGEAVHCRQTSVVLSSGAGCGKTHVLTERYLSHLRHDGADVGQIVAITFTDRAARQMRERIRRALRAELHNATDAEAETWVRHLRGLETAQITTIHAFAASLLRQHAVEAALDPRFDVLEDVLAANLRVEALTTCLQELLVAQEQAGEDLRQLIFFYGWRATVEAVEHLVGSAETTAWQTWLERPADQIAAEWLGSRRAELLPRYVDYLVAACPKIARCLWLLRTTPCIGPLTQPDVDLVLRDTPRLAQAEKVAAAVDELVEAAKVVKERGKAWRSDADYEAVKKAFEGFREELPERLKLFLTPAEDVAASVRVGQQFLRVAGQVIQRYRRLKQRAGFLDFQDLLVLARDLLRDHADVRAQAQRRYRFLLIDELQDTDPVQMELVELLCGGELTAGKLFAVGDVKQSIYRFRGAEVRQFQKLRESMPHAGRLGLTVNFRSQPAILHFANALFARHMPEYEALHPHLDQINPAECIEFLWSARADKENVAEARAVEADAIARRIAHMVNAQEALVAARPDRPGAPATLRPVRPGDIVLLFRSMSHVHLYEAALRRHTLDYYLVGGRAFFAQQEIYDLLNLLRCLENPQDGISLAGTLRSPFCCLSDEALFVLSQHPERLWEGLHDEATCQGLPEDQREAAERARRHLDRWRSLKDRLTIARLLGEVLAESGYDAALRLEFLGDRKLANLWKLLDLARTFDRSGLFGLAEFIARLGDLVRAQPREEQAATQPENADVVRLMTIHQAKGLEFPVVFVPDLAATAGGSHVPLAHWDDHLGCVVRPPADEETPSFPPFGHWLWKSGEAVAEWQEDLRTLYVACTRAQDYLVLSAALPSPFSPGNAWMLTLSERFDLRTGACLVEDLSQDQSPRVRVVENSGGAHDLVVEARDRQGVVVAPLAEGRGSATPSAANGVALAERPGIWPPEVARIPVRLATSRILRVADVEAHLSRLADGRKLATSRSEEVAFQFDAEDGSDLATWLDPREAVVPLLDPANAAFERTIRAVLSRWDMRQPEGWLPLLAELIPSESEPHRFETVLARFAAAPVRSELAAARQCVRDLDFMADLNSVDGVAGGTRLPAVHGLVDYCFQDSDGDWHLLTLMITGQPPTKRDASWRGRKLSLVLGAWAMQQRGRTPKSLILHHLESGRCLRCVGSPARQRATLAAARVALSELAQQVFP
jgi:ATP-dependent helicase/nuclease subunit A